ncbi:MAG: response regulator [Deltaproteobacteria bacterium]|nr:response regulator [Deltaproteobacteria bacterium]
MNQRAPIGQILADLGAVSEEQRSEAARQSPERPTRFASKLLQARAALEADLVEGLAVQKGVPGLDLSQSVIDLLSLDVVPRQIAEESTFLPVAIDEHHLYLAMANPDDRQLQDEIQFATGRTVIPYVALQSVLREMVPAAYDTRATGSALLPGERASASEAHLELIVPGARDSDEVEEEIIAITVDLEDEPLDLSEDIEVEEPLEASGSSGPKVLVVDDEEEIQNLLTSALVSGGYRVETAGRGLEALQKVKTFEPDAVILDAMLPEVHGFEICRKIRSSKRFGHVPVIMISAIYRGWRYAQDVTEVYGATDFLEKPFRLPDLLRRLKAALEGAKPVPEAGEEARERATRAYRRGVGLLKVGKVEGAIEAFQEGLAADPFAPSLHFSLGRATQMKGDVFGAISSYEKAVELKPDLHPALKSMALLYEKQGFRRKAIELWERALPVSPDAEARTLARDHLLRLLEAPAGRPSADE